MKCADYCRQLRLDDNRHEQRVKGCSAFCIRKVNVVTLAITNVYSDFATTLSDKVHWAGKNLTFTPWSFGRRSLNDAISWLCGYIHCWVLGAVFGYTDWCVERFNSIMYHSNLMMSVYVRYLQDEITLTMCGCLHVYSNIPLNCRSNPH